MEAEMVTANLACPKCGNADQEKFRPVVQEDYSARDPHQPFGHTVWLKAWRCTVCKHIVSEPSK
jgi:hypothetical protein